jgi:uncharacterized membrane protein
MLWLWNDVRALLLLQVALVVLSAVPIYLLAKARLNKPAACLLSAAYLLFWGFQQLIWFDFHELAFAVPILSLALYLIEKKRWHATGWTTLSLLLVKENLGLLVAAIGIYLLFKRQWRWAAALILSGLTWLGLMVGVIMPWLAGHGQGYNHWSYGQLGSTPLAAAKHLLTHPWQIITHVINNSTKINTLSATVGAFLWLPLLSPLILLALPSIFERMLSDNTAYWAIGYQYSALMGPILAFATLDFFRRYRITPRVTTLLLSLALVSVVGFTYSTNQPLVNLTNKSFYDSGSAKIGDSMLKLIPANASVVAQDQISPHLSHRDHIYELGIGPRDADYIAVNPALPGGDWPISKDKLRVYISDAIGRGYGVEFSEGDWLLLKRGAAPSTNMTTYNGN